VLDVLPVDHPRIVPHSSVPIQDARNVYVAHTYAYTRAGKQGLALVDVERRGEPHLDQFFSAGGKLNDSRDVKLELVDANAFAFASDGQSGVRVLQILSPEDSATPNREEAERLYLRDRKLYVVTDDPSMAARPSAGGFAGPIAPQGRSTETSWGMDSAL
jgi:hypothetical protein